MEHQHPNALSSEASHGSTSVEVTLPSGTPRRHRRPLPVGRAEILRARAKLDAFKAAKGELNRVIRFNEQWYRQRHMDYVKFPEGGTEAAVGKGRKDPIEPVSAWLFNSIQHFHADHMDSYPRANVLPRERGDELEAAKLTRILPPLLDRIGFEAVYSRAGWTKGIQGWSVYSVLWDKEGNGGRGEISVRPVKLLNLYWDMEADELDASSDLFYLHERDREELIREYPRLATLPAADDLCERHEGNADTTLPPKVTVVDWYYKRKNKRGRRVLHFCQFAGDVLLYASENEPAYAERGFYDHGRYPFVVDVLYPMEDQVQGFGKVAVGASKQAYIDILSRAILKNALWGAVPRYFAKKGHGFNPSDFLDLGNKLVEVEGDPREYLMRVDVGSLDGNVLHLKDSMVEELRETTNVRDVSTGSAPGGVTAASAIAALQEAAGKTGRDSNRTSFRAFREIVTMIIELIRQFYTDTHYFRVMGEEQGRMEYVGVDNRTLRERERGALFDLEITAERSSSYTRMAQNELMLSFFSAGFFDPAMADRAIACLRMMDFSGKEELIRMLTENDRRQELLGAVLGELRAMAEAYDTLSRCHGIPSDEASSVEALIARIPAGIAAPSPLTTLSLAGGESVGMKEARATAADAASPV